MHSNTAGSNNRYVSSDTCNSHQLFVVCCHGDPLFCFWCVTSTSSTFYSSSVVIRWLSCHVGIKIADPTTFPISLFLLQTFKRVTFRLLFVDRLHSIYSCTLTQTIRALVVKSPLCQGSSFIKANKLLLPDLKRKVKQPAER